MIVMPAASIFRRLAAIVSGGSVRGRWTSLNVMYLTPIVFAIASAWSSVNLRIEYDAIPIFSVRAPAAAAAGLGGLRAERRHGDGGRGRAEKCPSSVLQVLHVQSPFVHAVVRRLACIVGLLAFECSSSRLARSHARVQRSRARYARPSAARRDAILPSCRATVPSCWPSAPFSPARSRRARAGGQLTTSGSALVVVIPGSKQYHQPGCPLVRKAGSKVKVMKQAEAERRGLTAHDCSDPGTAARDAAAATNASTVYVQANDKQYHTSGCKRLKAGADGDDGREGRAGPLAVPRVQAADPAAREVDSTGRCRSGPRVEPVRHCQFRSRPAASLSAPSDAGTGPTRPAPGLYTALTYNPPMRYLAGTSLALARDRVLRVPVAGRARQEGDRHEHAGDEPADRRHEGRVRALKRSPGRR